MADTLTPNENNEECDIAAASEVIELRISALEQVVSMHLLPDGEELYTSENPDQTPSPNGQLAERIINVLDTIKASIAESEQEAEPEHTSMLTKMQSKLAEDTVELVKHVVFQTAVHFPRHVDREELNSAGRLGLIDAALKFDPERGIPFERYAARRIQGSILDHVRSTDQATRSVRSRQREIEKFTSLFALENTRRPTRQEVAEELGISVEELERHRAKHHRGAVLSMEHEVNSDEDEDLGLVDVLVDKSAPTPHSLVSSTESVRELYDAIAQLGERDKTIVRMEFLEQRPSHEIAEHLGVTESRLSQLRGEVVLRLREIMPTYANPDY